MDEDEVRERRSEDLRIADDVAQIRKDVDAILHGNGRKGVWALSDAVFGVPGKDDDGMVGQIKVLMQAQAEDRAMSANVRDIKLKVEALEKARAKDENQQEGSRRTLIVIGTILTALGGTAATFGYRTFQALGEILTALP